jgi:hypothetical protein
MATELIKIVKISRAQKIAKNTGNAYTAITVMDALHRKLSAYGKWTENWKEGDEVEGIIKEKTWTDKDGNEQIFLNIENPNPKPFTPRTSSFNPMISAYQIAATLAPLFYRDSKKIPTLEDIDKLANLIKERISIAPVSTTEEKKEVPVVDVAKEEVKVKAKAVEASKTEEFDETEEDPF